ncbi:hypothetical protein [Phaeodactylibacter luteus]|uniref:Uncharacterized protein n=1 Tax=Phaeodactylibacter luteus TaxID=1564516 RepID=A0A5C6RH80_9BACT|nr:hypothetical protein [Phaeodactylibacter luteus]TXB61808.1 hypothetical protein FRY97_17050 [Phaeodactylibacter luteus]
MKQEINKPTLDRAVAQLPGYSPPDSLWGNVEQTLARQKEEQPLRQALAALPKYEPGAENWDAIAERLGQSPQGIAFRTALSGLPVYTPPESAWEDIEQRLGPTGKRRRLWPKILQAAAATAALLAALWAVWPATGESGLKVAYEYGASALDPSLMGSSPPAAEAEGVQAVVVAFREDPVAQRHPEYQRTLQEWKELSAAHEEIKSIMARYGQDPALIRQIGEIERERAGLIQKMVREI